MNHVTGSIWGLNTNLIFLLGCVYLLHSCPGTVRLVYGLSWKDSKRFARLESSHLLNAEYTSTSKSMPSTHFPLSPSAQGFPSFPPLPSPSRLLALASSTILRSDSSKLASKSSIFFSRFVRLDSSAWAVFSPLYYLSVYDMTTT